ncbi:MAG: DUF421 domain-containing protein [Gemmatimonadaceae bacterium]
MSPISTDLWVPGIPIIEKVARSVIVYFFLIVILRLAGKRTLGQLTSFDLVVLLLLSNTVQNAIIGNDNSLSGGLIGAAVLVALNYVIVRSLYRHKRAERALEGGVTILVRHGKFLDDNMKRQLITHAELEAAARRQGIQRMSDVRVARLELGGAVTFELNSPTEQDRHIADVLARLERIEAKLDGGSSTAELAR